ncbi:unnamed protein product [Adineta ricciae]|uniref:Uncharacterized protein n=1 Tax=Adineta ricciae TaxID=249248 RepID=A0A815AGM4_ADIRI|nr:unnamed protein product [Adineta ricciae]CAF1307753.1 unnamed protein product [Adineta ricciae]
MEFSGRQIFMFYIIRRSPFDDFDFQDQNYLISKNNFREIFIDRKTIQVPLGGLELSTHAINTQNLLNSINDRKPFVTIVFLNCCRTYHLHHQELQKDTRGEPNPSLHGLKPMPAEVRTLIAFACAPGTTTDDGNNDEKKWIF